MNKIKLLVTGCGGDIGQSIGKILSELSFVDQTFGLDISDHNPASFIFDYFEIGLRCDHHNYIESLNDFVSKHDIDAIIPASEPELRFLHEIGSPQLIGNAKLIYANSLALEVGFDKLKTSNFLKLQNLNYPETKLLTSASKVVEFPVIVKAKTGSGSKDVRVVKSDLELSKINNEKGDLIIQEFISNNAGEYTCGVFRSKKGEVRTIILKRELTGGYSGYGEVVANNTIENYIQDVANRLELIGSINMQLRLRGDEPVIFEINPRFSSTVRFRDLFGFKDVLWSLEDAFDENLSDYKADSVGKKFYKGFDEYIR